MVLEHNKGFRVAAKPCSEDIYQWHEAKMIIESSIATAMIQKITIEELDKLKRLNDSIRCHGEGSVFENHTLFISLNIDFHKTIVNAAGNNLINEMYTSLNYGPYVTRFPEGNGISDLNSVCGEHDEIICAIEEKILICISKK
ncbi:FCD domain-containing protein [Acerihabitans sp. KWT182]|uniref:FCD domain-containing protein n=1 Tax=Acerihabitans sp. KWT182 TaxID=3157919 RepID=A0AAU7Q9Z5_9GAMM